MRQIIIIALILSLTNCGTKNTYDENSSINIGYTLTPFNVVLYTCGEVNQRHELNIYTQDNKYYADNVSPYYYIGKRTDSVWTVELDQFRISTCNKFLDKIRSLPKECPVLSTCITRHIITSASDTIIIRGDCNSDSLDFFAFRQIIFQDKFNELELKKSNLIDNLNRSILGTWYYKPFKSSPKHGDYLVLTKANDFVSKCSWEFGTEHSFRSSCNEVLDFTYTEKYAWHTWKDIYLVIQGGIITYKDSSMAVGNDDATFTLEAITDHELRLKYLW